MERRKRETNPFCMGIVFMAEVNLMVKCVVSVTKNMNFCVLCAWVINYICTPACTVAQGQ